MGGAGRGVDMDVVRRTANGSFVLSAVGLLVTVTVLGAGVKFT